jgi:hypothetical protein
MPSPQAFSSLRPTNRFRARSSLASAATLAAVAAPSLLRAQIVWSGALNSTVNSGTTEALLDLNKNTSPDNTEAYLSFSPFDGKGGPYLNVSGIASAKTDPTIAFLYQDSSVAFGSTINSGLTYVGEHPANLVPADGNSYYYAFEYQAGGGPYYGWMQVTYSADGNTGTLNQWAYNSVSGAALTAGQTSAIPEPSAAAALLGLAAIGGVWWRRRRQSACPA